MKTAIKNISKSVLFIAILLVLLVVSSHVIQMRFLVGENNTRNPMASGSLDEPENTIDSIILGDSETYSSFIPLKIWQDYGITSYVCGSTGQQLCYSVEFLRKSFTNQKPKVVFLETNAIFRKFGYSNVIGNKAEEILPIFRYHDRWKMLQAKGGHFIEGSKGYWYSTSVNPSKDTDYMKKNKKTDKYPKKNAWFVEQMKTFCEKNGAKLVLVSTPSTKNWNDRRHDSIQKLADDVGIEYIDMNVLTDEVPIDWSCDTRDKGDHLNHYGAMKVSEYLGEYLSETDLFSDKRSSPEYEQWNEFVDKFNKKTDNSLES